MISSRLVEALPRYVAAIRASQWVKCLIVEKSLLGGTCLHKGCIPKSLLKSAEVHHTIKMHIIRY